MSARLVPGEGRGAAGEQALTIPCGSEHMVAILHPSEGEARRQRGVLMIVGGGPQYRAGGHRQLNLWGRRLAAAGYPVLRFDYRGMGDSTGEYLGFEHIRDDVQAAAEALAELRPDVHEMVLWGECDAASAILMDGIDDRRVTGIALQNPWVHSEQGRAKTMLRWYYVKRLKQLDFWKKVLGLRFNPLASIKSLLGNIHQARSAPDHAQTHDIPYQQRMLQGLTRFEGRVMLVLSEHDIIAREFHHLVDESPEWRRQLNPGRTTRLDLEMGDHTFSSQALRDRVIEASLAWMESW